jgi:hypothetical protein
VNLIIGNNIETQVVANMKVVHNILNGIDELTAPAKEVELAMVA